MENARKIVLNDQKLAEIGKLRRKCLKNALFIGIKYGFLLVAANVLIALFSHYFVDGSTGFSFLASLTTAFLLFYNLDGRIKAERAMINEEVTKILGS